MPLQRSQDQLRAQNWRPNELPGIPDAAVTAPDRDPTTGRFTKGNGASRRRALKRLSRELRWLDPTQCAPWVRPYVEGARAHAIDLLAQLPQSPMVNPLAEELATARLVYRAYMALGLAGDAKALSEARAWLREARQHAVALEGLARETAGRSEDDESDLRHRQAEFQRNLAARQKGTP